MTAQFSMKLWSRVAAAITVASSFVVGPALAAEQSVAYQINAAHTGAIELPGLTPTLTKRWTVDLGNRVSYPLIAEGRVFVAVADNTFNIKKLVALDLATGAKLWEKSIPSTYWRLTTCYE